MNAPTLSTRVSSGGLLAIVAGRTSAVFHSPAECLAVAGLLSAAAAFVVGAPRRSPGLSRLGAAGVVMVLSARGALGLAGRTGAPSPPARAEAGMMPPGAGAGRALLPKWAR